MHLRVVIILALIAPFCLANPWANYVFYDRDLQQIESAERGAIIVYAMGRGFVPEPLWQKMLHRNASELLKERRGPRVYLSPPVNSLVAHADPGTTSRLMKRVVNLEIGDIRGIENSVVRYNWARPLIDALGGGPMSMELLSPEKQEALRFIEYVRSFFIADAIIEAYDKKKKNVVAGIDVAMMTYPFVRRISEADIPVNYSIHLEVDDKAVVALKESAREDIRRNLDVEDRRSLQVRLIENLMTHAQEAYEDPTRSFPTEGVDLQEVDKDMFFEKRRREGYEVLNKCDECLCFLGRMGVR